MSLYCEERGNKNGPTIVFIHGGGVAGWMWKKQWEALGGFHILVPDLPEHGKSRNIGPISIQDCAGRIAALIRERANGGRAHVVGHSLGAKIIVELLATHPELVDRAVVASALYRPIPLLNAMLNMPTYRFTVWILRNKSILDMQVRQFAFPDGDYIEHFKQETASESAEMLDHIYTELNKHLKLPQGLGHAKTPTLVVCGEQEPKAMRQSVLDVAQALPNGKACLVSSAKHNFPWAQHEVFNHVIGAWLNGQPADHPLIRTDF